MLSDLSISRESLFYNDGLLCDALFKPLFDFLRVLLTFEKTIVYLFNMAQ